MTSYKPTQSDRLHPQEVYLHSRVLLTKPTSSKRTYHLVLDLADSGLQFKVGDSIGIYPENDPLLVQHLITAMHATGEELILNPRTQEPITLRAFLTTKANLSRLNSSFLKLFYEYTPMTHQKHSLEELLRQENRAHLASYLNSHDPLSLLKEYQQTVTPLQELCAQFSPLLPRFYSVASSPLRSKNTVDLLVTLFTFTHGGEQRYGVGSHFLCALATPLKTTIRAYVQPAHHFALPEDLRTPLIMVGPGTGVAPFRAFLQERIHKQAAGKHWLFFGERHRATDFLYEEEWHSLVAQGKLKLDLAFSRDQTDKLYVQHRMYEQRTLLWQWLQEGAFFYVCGDANPMAKDVDTMLHTIVSQEGKLSDDETKAFIKSLKTQKRYLSDVY